jgi:hypothetical protein
MDGWMDGCNSCAIYGWMMMDKFHDIPTPWIVYTLFFSGCNFFVLLTFLRIVGPSCNTPQGRLFLFGWTATSARKTRRPLLPNVGLKHDDYSAEENLLHGKTRHGRKFSPKSLQPNFRIYPRIDWKLSPYMFVQLFADTIATVFPIGRI